MTIDLFAGVAVSDLATASAWYERLLGTEAFVPNDTEAVWELDERRFLYIEELPRHAGHARHTIFTADFDERIVAIARRGIEPISHETNDNGVRKALFRDPDGNEIGFGGNPV